MTAKDEFHSQFFYVKDKLNFFAIRSFSDKNGMEKLLQDPFLKTFAYHNQFGKLPYIKTWVYKAIKNFSIYKHIKTEYYAIFNNIKDLFFFNMDIDDSYNELDFSHKREEVNRALEQMGDAFKVPFQMHTEGYKHHEIAEKLNLEIGTVKSRIFFTRRKIMDVLR